MAPQATPPPRTPRRSHRPRLMVLLAAIPVVLLSASPAQAATCDPSTYFWTGANANLSINAYNLAVLVTGPPKAGTSCRSTKGTMPL